MKPFKEYLEEMLGRNLEEARGLEKFSRKFIPGYTKRKIQKQSDKWAKRQSDTYKTANGRSKRAGEDDWTIQDYKDTDKSDRAQWRYDRIKTGNKPFSKPYPYPPSKDKQKVKNI